MDDEVFEAAKAKIDSIIDNDEDSNLGIAMSFALAGEFMTHGLLEIIHFEFLGNWDARKYRGRYVLPDPMMSDAQFAFGSSSITGQN